MPELDPQKKAQATADVATQPVAGGPATTGSTTGKDLLRMRAGAAGGYEEGAALLKPDKAPAPEDAKAAEKKDVERLAAAKKGYEQALGKFLGGKLFDLVHKELAAAKLLGYGKKGVDAMGAVTDLIKPTDDGAAGGVMDEQAEADAAKAFADALVQWAQGEAGKWLEGDDGQALLEKINHWVEGHPRTVALSLVGAALAAATVAYVTNASIPELSQSFKLGKGFQLKGGADLGKVQDIALRAAELGLSYQAEGLSAGLSAKYEAKETDGKKVESVGVKANVAGGGHTADASAKVSTDDSKSFGVGYTYKAPQAKGADGKADPKDQPLEIGTQGDVKTTADGGMVIDAKGSIKKDRLEASASHNRTAGPGGAVTDQKTKASVAWGDPSNRHNVDGVYDHTKNQFVLSTGNTRVHEGPGYKLTQKDTYTPDGKTTDLQGKLTSPDKATAVTLGVNSTGDRTNSASVGVQYSKDWLKGQLDVAFKDGQNTAAASLEAKKGNLTASAAAKLNIDDARLTELSLKLGWKDPKQFESFLLEYKRSWLEDKGQYGDSFDAMLETTLGKVALRVQGQVGLQGGQLSNAGVKGMAAYPLGKDWKALGGAGYDWQDPSRSGDLGLNKGSGATVYGGVQYKNIPLTVGYRPGDKAWTLGVTIPF